MTSRTDTESSPPTPDIPGASEGDDCSPPKRSSASAPTSSETAEITKPDGPDASGPLTRDEVRVVAFRSVGIEPHELGAEVIEKTRDLMSAEKTRFAQHEGAFTDSVEVEDNPTRLGAVRLGAEIAGIVSSRSGGEGSGKPAVVIVLPVWAAPNQAEPIIDVEPTPAGS